MQEHVKPRSWVIGVKQIEGTQFAVPVPVQHASSARLHGVRMVKKAKKRAKAAGEDAPGAQDAADAAETLERAWKEVPRKKRRLRPAEPAEQVEQEEEVPKAKGRKKRKAQAVEEQGEAEGAESKEMGEVELGTAECLKVCAANLPYWFDKARIWRRFAKAGDVQDVWLLYDKWTWESKGIAFITLGDQTSVKAALELDGSCLSGQVIRVNLATDKAEKGKGSGKAPGKVPGKAWGQGKGTAAPLALGDKPPTSLGLMARGLSFEVSEDDLRSAFQACGSGPTRVRLLVDKAGQSKGKAFIDFKDEASLQEAVKLNETLLKGRALRLEYSHAEKA